MPEGYQDLLAYADQAQYVGVDDELLLQVITSCQNANITITARLLREDGVIVPITQVFALPTTYTLSTFQIQLAKGFLLGLEVLGAAPQLAGGWTYAKVDLTRGSLADTVQYQTIMAGYVSPTFGYGYPKQKYQRPTDGPGTLNSVNLNGADPGGELVYFQPSNSRSKPISILGTLATSAVAGNRSVSVWVEDAEGVPVWQQQASGVQAANTTVNYNLSSLSLLGGSAAAGFNIPFPFGLFLGGGFILQTITSGIDVGDQWLGQALVSEWADL